ncbi:unnamed protein product, partial [Symbiodinium sp. CCMP2592]
MPEPDTTPMPPVPEPSTAPMIVEAQEEETDEDECWANVEHHSLQHCSWLECARSQLPERRYAGENCGSSLVQAASQRKEAGSVVPSTWGTAACDSTEGPRLNSYGAKYAPKGANYTTEVSDYTTKGANYTDEVAYYAPEGAYGDTEDAEYASSGTCGFPEAAGKGSEHLDGDTAAAKEGGRKGQGEDGFRTKGATGDATKDYEAPGGATENPHGTSFNSGGGHRATG